MSQEELLKKIQMQPGIKQVEITHGGHESHMINQLVKKGYVRREIIRSPRNFFRLYPTGKGL